MEHLYLFSNLCICWEKAKCVVMTFFEPTTRVKQLEAYSEICLPASLSIWAQSVFCTKLQIPRCARTSCLGLTHILQDRVVNLQTNF
jgi:hypothetical protein